MFDPTVYENLKVVIEGNLYDLDLEGQVTIIDRKDTIDLAKIERSFAIKFREKNCLTTAATFMLDVDCSNLAAEILEHKTETPGCSVSVSFERDVSTEALCDEIERVLYPIWGEHEIIQRLSYYYNKKNRLYRNNISINFKKKITEDHVGDLQQMIHYILRSLAGLNKIAN